jgi:hypothetical protein
MSVCRRCYIVKKDATRHCPALLQGAYVMCQYSREPPRPFFGCTIRGCCRAVETTRLFCGEHTTAALLDTVLIEVNPILSSDHRTSSMWIGKLKNIEKAQDICLHNDCGYRCARVSLLQACLSSISLQAQKGLTLDLMYQWRIRCPGCFVLINVTSLVNEL